MRIAIVGAGMAGMSCALRLDELGHEVALFDKGRGPGGRMATRRIEHDGRMLHFDHGAQYFTVRDPRFASRVEAWERGGIVARWPEAGAEAWVGTPAMNAPLKAMASHLDLRFGTRIDSLDRTLEGWRLRGDGVPDAMFDAVIVALPAEQAAPLLTPHAQTMGALAAATASDPCWTLMVAFSKPLSNVEATLRDAGPIGWAARNSTKPQRSDEECWVVQGSPEWSRAHLEEDAEMAGAALLDAFSDAVGAPLPPILARSAHRWRYAKSGAAGTQPLWDDAQRIGACGDWLIAPRVEAAFLSGLELAEAIGAGE
ncbi:MAG: NAD(P)-binding protein [Erythrobacter sp.]|uniref:NAD(P)/FAD-dependent oxidoreductase n=1 Tax=Erythrobacter sp. TaxID=1042 RepID=UPI001B11B7FF|nr:FAD-dependent oxidoreductase [Erythrobacter sp.]MBO6767571.1 NAD(P)-binding protein [Erythrobacter sp.]